MRDSVLKDKLNNTDKQIILVSKEDLRYNISLKQYEFMVSVLYSMDVPEEELKECFSVDGFDSFSVDHRIKLRKVCDKYAIDIIDDKDGGMKIYVNNETLVAEWKKPWSMMRHDHAEINPLKRLFMEVHLNWWTVFDDGTTE